MAKLPWRKWYQQDWLSDDQVGQATPAARGLWIECLNVMMNKSCHTISGTSDTLARMLRFTPSEFKKALKELELTSTADIRYSNELGNDFVTITSRRLSREDKERERIRLAVRSSRGKKSVTHSVTECNSASPSASSSISVSESGNRGAGEGVFSFAEYPSLDEVKAKAEMIGLAPWKAEDWWHEMQGCGWLDYNHRPIRDWASVLSRVRTKWEADRRPMAPPSKPVTSANGKPMTAMDYRTVIQAKEALASEIRGKFCSETAIDQVWSDLGKRQEYFKLKREIKAINNQLSNMA